MSKPVQPEEKIIFTSEKVEEIRKKEEDGYKIKRHEKFWYANYPLVRRANLNFRLSDEEQLEYAKCMLGIDTENMPYLDPYNQTLGKTGVQYFAETYCKIKTETGEVKNMKLRDYQYDILDMFTDNRFSCLLASRQVGKCSVSSSYVKTKDGDISLSELYHSTIEKPTILQIVKFHIYRLIKMLD